MPPFFSDAIQSLYTTWGLILASWESLALTTRILIALSASGGTIYAATKAEETAWSAALFFVAFGIFSYVIFAGYSFLQ
jgi:hypothetical protein